MRPKTLKKITPAAVFALAAFAALAALALASCGATAFERMQGRWNLAATSVGDESFRPGDEWRIGDYFLELMPDGTFRELGFWNEGVVVAGQWRASVFGLRLIPEEPADGNLPFAQRRAPKISEDGNSLTTRHRRRWGAATLAEEYERSALDRAAAPEAARILGRWNLASHSSGGIGAFFPGDEWWLDDYFLELDPEGTFRELNFWNDGFVASGQWRLSGRNLTLALTTEHRGDFPFIESRRLGISAEGILLMEYHDDSDGAWDHAATFVRAP